LGYHIDQLPYSELQAYVYTEDLSTVLQNIGWVVWSFPGILKQGVHFVSENPDSSTSKG